jgi:hypothetical protein
MSVYVVCSCFVGNLNSKVYLTEVLLKFAQQNTLRVGIDTDRKLIDIYSKIAESKPEIASWLSLMSYEPTSFQEIVKLEDSIKDEFHMFLFVCKSIVNKNCMIVDTIQNFNLFEFVDEKHIMYTNKKICLIEKDDAIEELKDDKMTVNIKDSIVAKNGSKIERVKN